MSESNKLGPNQAYTTQGVEFYLQAVAERRAELNAAIAHARARRARALELERRLASLEQRLGKWILTNFVVVYQRTAPNIAHQAVNGPDGVSLPFLDFSRSADATPS
jgi:hypothetical protein